MRKLFFATLLLLTAIAGKGQTPAEVKAAASAAVKTFKWDIQTEKKVH